jgi:hypothetical protein
MKDKIWIFGRGGGRGMLRKFIITKKQALPNTTKHTHYL